MPPLRSTPPSPLSPTHSKRDDTVNIAGFAKFATSHRETRQGRNPRSGAPVAIPANTVPTFKAGKALRDTLNA